MGGTTIARSGTDASGHRTAVTPNYAGPSMTEECGSLWPMTLIQRAVHTGP